MAYRIQLSEKAKDHIRQLIEREKGIGFKVSIKKTGCSGYSYLPTIVKQPESQDELINNIADFPIYMDNKYAELLQEVSIDLIEGNALGLKQKKLVFNNPKESGRCGCGESFHVKEGK